MERDQKTRLINNLLLAGLFSVIGILFHLLLTNYGELIQRAPDMLVSAEAALMTIAMFNLLGFSLLWINSYLTKRSLLFMGYGSRLVWNFIFIAIVLLLLHYGIMVMIKWIVGMHPAYILRGEGVRIILGAWAFELVIVGLLLAVHSARNTLRLYQEKEQLREIADKAQYQALQHQLNPHFLFNSLNTLMSEIQYDPTNALRFTQNLSDVYRYVLQQEDKKLATLREELDFLNAYIFLHRVRLGDCLTIERCFPERILEAKLPPLTLQLLTENVIKHNYIDEANPMTIHLALTEDGSKLSVTNLMRPKHDVRSSGKGLRNLSERYRLLCSQHILVEKKENEFIVTIPLIYE